MKKTCARFAAILLVIALSACLLALPAGAAGEQTIEAMFKGKTGGGRSNLSLQLEGDTATFSYSPLFFVERNFPGYDPLTDGDVASIVDMCVAGFKQWEGEYQVRGRTLTLVVNVDAAMAASKSKATVIVEPDGGSAAGTASFTGFFWRPNRTTVITLYPYNPHSEWFYAGTPAHEFGHAIGLNDAYSYGVFEYFGGFFGFIVNLLADFAQPEAPEYRAPWDAIMRGSWRGAAIYDRDVEMVLWAWKHGKFQLYTESILMYLFPWFELSPVFFNN